jgi:RNA polymerase sigma-54 factor
MAFDLRLEAKLSQSLVMTPQLQQAIKLLQLSRLELVETVSEEIETNPALECEGINDTPTAPEASADTERKPDAAKDDEVAVKGDDFDWQSYVSEYNDAGPKGVNFNNNPEGDSLDNITDTSSGLHDHLLSQLHLSGLTENENALGEFIIGNIDGDGYLRVVEDSPMGDAELEEAALTEIGDHLKVEEAEVLKVLKTIQMFEPAGVAARSTRECLLLQAKCLPVRDTVVESIITDYLPELANKNYKAIARKLSITFDEVIRAARKIVKELNPMPGSAFGTEELSSITPDVFIKKVAGEYVVSQNDTGLPRLKISPYYRNLMNNGAEMTEEAKEYIQERFRSAIWLIKSIHQRHRTIYRVVESIVRFQREFLDKGVQHLKPLTLKDVADDIGVHESTVSRVTSNKYAETPRGTYRLKYFFSNSLGNLEGEDVSVEYIKNTMLELFSSEDNIKPLSDMKLVTELKRYDIDISRRTVTKYREALGVLSSHKRKSYLKD